MITKIALPPQPVHAPYGECRGVVSGVCHERYLMDVCKMAVLFSDDGKLTLSQHHDAGFWNIEFVVSDVVKKATFLEQVSLCGTFL